MPLPRPREALGVLRCVLFAPEDLAVVKGDPDQRRRYLDDLLVATRPRFAGVRSDYERVVRQRSALLKSARARGGGVPRGLEVWDDQLVATGAELTAGRLGLVAAIRPHVAMAYSAVSGAASDSALRYRPSFRAEMTSPIRSRTSSRPRCARRWGPAGGPSWSAASAWSGRTGTSWS